MMNDGVGACKARKAVKQISVEVLDESPGKRFDTSGRLFWNRSTLAGHGEARRVSDEREQWPTKAKTLD